MFWVLKSHARSHGCSRYQLLLAGCAIASSMGISTAAAALPAGPLTPGSWGADEKPASQKSLGDQSGANALRQTERSEPSAALDKTEFRTADSVVEFAQQHHPELADLLKQLQSAKSPEFERAVRQLSGEMTRLERIQDKTPGRYEFELEVWKIESQTRLLLARWAMSRDPELEQQVRDLLRRRREIRIQQLSQEKQRLDERVESLTDQIRTAQHQLNQQVDDEWQRLARRAGTVSKSGAAPKTVPGRPAAGRAVDKPSASASDKSQ